MSVPTDGFSTPTTGTAQEIAAPVLLESGRQQEEATGGSADLTHTGSSHLPLELLCKLQPSWEGLLPSFLFLSLTTWPPMKASVLRGGSDTISPLSPCGRHHLGRGIPPFWISSFSGEGL